MIPGVKRERKHSPELEPEEKKVCLSLEANFGRLKVQAIETSSVYRGETASPPSADGSKTNACIPLCEHDIALWAPPNNVSKVIAIIEREENRKITDEERKFLRGCLKNHYSLLSIILIMAMITMVSDDRGEVS